MKLSLFIVCSNKNNIFFKSVLFQKVSLLNSFIERVIKIAFLLTISNTFKPTGDENIENHPLGDIVVICTKILAINV